ncbi:MAG: glutathione S-transferase N-terminal domain-containing protein [Porticoccaceae bacterium]
MVAVTRRSSMTLFSDPTCHYSHRVRIVLAEKGIAVDIENVDPKAVPEEVLEFNPYGTLPMLVDRDLALYESKVMMEYLDERFPHPPLLPVYPVARALSRQFMYRVEKDWCVDVQTILNSGDNKEVERARKSLRENLMAVAPIFAEMPYFMNEEFTLVDCCLAPLLWRLEILGVKLPNSRQTKPMLTYMQTLFERPAFRLSLSDQEREMR